jgi:ABC-type branched-subunit amino acid transport system ATPase component/predicted MFS family arabinose efflux permease
VNRLRRATGGAAVTPLLVLLGLNAVDELDRTAFAALSPEIRSSFGVSVGAISAIAALSSFTILLAGYPLGFVSDRLRRTTVAGCAAAVWALATFLTGVVAGVLLLCVVRAVSGIGQAVNRPTHSSLLSDYYPPDRHSRVFSAYYLGNPLGQGVALALIGPVVYLADRITGAAPDETYWQPVFWLLAVPSALLVIASFRLTEPPRGGVETSEEEALAEQVPFREAFRTILTIRTLRRDYGGAALVGGGVIALAAILANFYEEVYGVGPTGRGLLLGAGVAFSVVGNVAGGFVGDRLYARSPAYAQQLIGWSIVAIGVFFALAAVAPVLWLSVGFAWLGALCNGVYNGPGARITAAVVPARIRAQGYAAVDVFLAVGIFTAVPAFLVVDAHGLRWGLFSLTPLLVVGGLIYVSAQRFVVNDIARAARAVEAERERLAMRRAGRTPVLLEVRGLTAGYGGVPVVEDVDLTIREGELVALLGTNGAGKSTLLKAISGALEPMSGSVVLAGYDITGFDPELSVARGVVQVPGGQGVFPGLTVDEHLRLAAVPLRDRSHVAAARAEAFELFPRLLERRGQLAGTLSGGEQQMLTIAQALIARPKLLMIDELSLGLAPKVVGELVAVVERIHRQGTAVLLVEQSVNIALTVADEAVFLEKGRIRFRGPAADLLGRTDLLRSIFLAGSR